MNGRDVNMLRRVRFVNYGNTGGTWSGFSQGDRFAVRWTGLIQILKPGAYRLSVGSDDGSKLFIDNKYVLNNDGLHGFRWAHTNRRLVRGQSAVRIEFFENGGAAGCKFYYRGADTNNKFTLVRRLSSRVEKGFKEEIYYIGGMRRVPNLNRRAAKERVIKYVNYGNTNRNWSGYRSADNFASRWSGTLHIRHGGRYRWRTCSDDGSNFYLNGRRVVSNDGLHGFRCAHGDIGLGASRVQLRTEFFERGGHAGMQLAYMGPDTGMRMVLPTANSAY